MSNLETMHNVELVVMGGLFLVTFASVFVYGFHGFLKVNKWVFRVLLIISCSSSCNVGRLGIICTS